MLSRLPLPAATLIVPEPPCTVIAWLAVPLNVKLPLLPILIVLPAVVEVMMPRSVNVVAVIERFELELNVDALSRLTVPPIALNAPETLWVYPDINSVLLPPACKVVPLPEDMAPVPLTVRLFGLAMLKVVPAEIVPLVFVMLPALVAVPRLIARDPSLEMTPPAFTCTIGVALFVDVILSTPPEGELPVNCRVPLTTTCPVELLGVRATAIGLLVAKLLKVTVTEEGMSTALNEAPRFWGLKMAVPPVATPLPLTMMVPPTRPRSWNSWMMSAMELMPVVVKSSDVKLGLLAVEFNVTPPPRLIAEEDSLPVLNMTSPPLTLIVFVPVA